MQAEQNKVLVLQFYKTFDDRQMDRALELLAPNFTAHMAGMPKPLNRQEFQQFGLSFYLAFSQGQHIFDEIVVAEDKVVTCGMFIGNHVGEFQGLPPTGKQISLAIMHIDRVENGKIVEHWGQGDALGLMQQLGIMFLPSPKLLPPILIGTISKLFKKFQ
jgi:predicted ester cyclase